MEAVIDRTFYDTLVRLRARELAGDPSASREMTEHAKRALRMERAVALRLLPFLRLVVDKDNDLRLEFTALKVLVDELAIEVRIGDKPKKEKAKKAE
ncbi:MAG: hypothetical protein WC683_05835 [bacterium]